MSAVSSSSRNYAEALLLLGVPADEVEKADQIFREAPDVMTILKSPLVAQAKKERVIDRIFPPALCNFLKTACIHGRIGQAGEMFEAYRSLKRQREGTLLAQLLYVTPPDEATVEQMKEYLRKKYHKKKVILEQRQDSSLIGGFLLRAGDYEIDYSLRGRYRRLWQTLTRR